MILAGYLLGALTLLGAAGLAAWCRAHPKQHNRFAHDALLGILYGLGAWLILPNGWPWSVAYLVIVVLGSLWFIVRVCPHCAYHGLRACPNCEGHGRAEVPSTYCVVAARLAGKGDPQRFASRFRRNLGAVAAAWVLPVVGGVAALRQPDNLAHGLVLLTVFGVIAFCLVPAAAKPACQECLNKDACPRGGCGKDTKDKW
jgi:hypothetical protein